MHRHSAVFIAFATFCTGFLLSLSLTGGLAGLSAPPRAEVGGVAQALQQHAVRLAAIEQSLTTVAEAVQHATRTSALSRGHFAATLPGETVLRQEVARLLRDELRAVLAAAGATPAEAVGEERVANDILNTPENAVAYQEAHEIVRFALADRRWTDEDAHALRTTFASLTTEQWTEVLETLVPAINHGEVAVETSGPPF